MGSSQKSVKVPVVTAPLGETRALSGGGAGQAAR